MYILYVNTIIKNVGKWLHIGNAHRNKKRRVNTRVKGWDFEVKTV